MKRLGISILLLFAVGASAAQLTIDDVGTFSTPKDMMGAIDDNFTELYSASSNTIIIGNESAARVELPVATSTVVGRGASGAIDDMNEATFKSVFNLETLTDFSVSSDTIIIGDESGDTVELPVATSTVIGRGATGAINDMDEATFKALFNLESGVDYLGLTNTTEFTPNADYEPATKKYVDDNGTDLDDIGDPTANGSVDLTDKIMTFVFGSGAAWRFQGTDAGDYWEFVYSAGNVLLRPVGGAFAQLGTFTVADGETALKTDSGAASTTMVSAEDSDTSTYSPLIRAVNGSVPYGALGGLTNYWKFDTDGALEPIGGAPLEIPNGTTGTTDATGEIFLDTDGDGGTNLSGPMVQISTNDATLGYLFPIAAIPSNDGYVLTYDSSTKTVGWEAAPGAAGGDSVSINSSAVTDPDFVSTGNIAFTDASNTITANIKNDSDLTSLTGDWKTTGVLAGKANFTTVGDGSTLAASELNGVIYLAGGGEITIPDASTYAETNGAGFVSLWNSDGATYEIVSADGNDAFTLKGGTVLTAGNELDLGTTNGCLTTLMAIGANSWRVFSEDATSSDGGAAD